MERERERERDYQQFSFICLKGIKTRPTHKMAWRHPVCVSIVKQGDIQGATTFNRKAKL